MKKVLYITANPKPENLSTSKTVARTFLNKYKRKHPNDEITELDLYNEDIPEMDYNYISTRATLISGKAYDNLIPEFKQKVDRINFLSDQFVNADNYIIAVPMWSVFFPPKLIQYLDAVIINGKALEISDEKVQGLMDDKERTIVFIESSGGVYPKIMLSQINHGYNYIHDIFKFLGVKNFKKILIQGVDMNDVGKEKAIEKAMGDMEKVLSNI